MQGFAPAIEVSSVSYTVLVLLVNSPVHRLLKLPANVIEAQQWYSASTISMVPCQHTDCLCISTALSCTASPEKTPMRTVESPEVTERCCPCYISKSKHLSRPRTDVCSLPEIKQGLWGLAVVHRPQRTNDMLLMMVLISTARQRILESDWICG